jgi:AcrR family transcriptional regulator
MADRQEGRLGGRDHASDRAASARRVPAPRAKKQGSEPRQTPARRTQQDRTAASTQRLTEAAIELISEKGFNNTTTAEIGERAGYSRSMVQFRYGTKEALLESLLLEEYEPMLLTEPSPTATGLERVLAQIDRLNDQVITTPGLMRGFFVLSFEALGPLKSLSDWICDWLERYESATVAAIRTGIDDGTIRPEIDPQLEAGALVAACIGQAFRWTAAPDAVDIRESMLALRDRVEARLAVPPASD